MSKPASLGPPVPLEQDSAPELGARGWVCGAAVRDGAGCHHDDKHK